MKITKTSIVNFRNIAKAELTLSEGLNIFCGENGQGKTNTVEAVLLTLSGRSHRESLTQNFIKENETAGRVKVCALTDENTSHELACVLADTKLHLLDNARVKNRAELLEDYPVIFFGPDDLRIIKDAPAERRKFLNDAVSVASPVYDTTLAEYNKLLRQRNALLKNYSPSDVYMLEVYDASLVKYACSVLIARMNYLREFSPVFSALYEQISSSREEVSLGYVSDMPASGITSAEEMRAAYENMLIEARRQDISVQSTTRGIHHDDIAVYMDGRSARKFSSQGQQRTTALCMKLACAEMLYKKRNKRALILLDDVMSELDDRRKESVLSSLNDYQIMVTCVKPDFAFEAEKTALFNVKNGIIS